MEITQRGDYMNMFRGSTPRVTLSSDDVDFTTCEEIIVTFLQGNKSNYHQVDVKKEDMEVSGTALTFRLTQDDTLTFYRGKDRVFIQVKIKNDSDVVLVSELGSFNMNEVLNEEVI